jgi:hypothetical protein
MRASSVTVLIVVRLLEVEDHRRVVALAEFVPQSVEDHLSL